MSNDKQRISVIFEKSKNKQTIPVTGVWGGPSPDGYSIVTHFYVEHNTTPNAIESTFEEDKPYNPNLGDQIKRGDITREIQTSLVMSPEQAISIGKWLAQKGQLIIDERSKRGQNDE